MNPGGSGGLLERIARGAGWVMAWRLGMRVLGLVSTLILVRLLAPAEFGLVALATGFVQTIDAMMALGADDAVVRESRADRDLYDTAFTLNLLRGLAVGLVVVLCAWPAAAFFADPRLSGVLLCVAALPVLDGLANIGTVDFRRDLLFRKEFAIMVLPKLGGILAAIAVAFLTHSYVAMLAGMGVNRGLRVVMSYVMHPYRPGLSLRAWRRLIGYSFWSWLIGIAILLRDKSDTFMLGRVLGTTSIGYYSVGSEIAALPTTELVEPLCRSAFSGFAAERREGASGSPLFTRLIGLAASVVLPAGIGLSLVADPLVAVALGPAWAQAAPVARVLAVAGTLTVFGQIALHLISAHGLLGRLLGVTLFGAALRIFLLFLLIPTYGLLGAAWAVGIGIAVEQALTLGLALYRLRIAPALFLGAIWRPVVAGGAMAYVLWQAGLGWVASDDAVSLIAAIALGAVVYACVLLGTWLLSGRPAGAERDCLNAAAGMFRR